MENYNICIACSSNMFKKFDHRNFEYFQCQSCQHVTTFPYPTSLQIQKHYLRGFREGNYKVIREHNETYYAAMKKICDLIESFLFNQNQTIDNSSVLDVGCFTGEFLLEMKKRGAEVYGVEFQKEAVKIAEKKLSGRIFNEDILSNDFSMKNHQFDLITLLGIIEHVTDPAYLLKRVDRLIKPNGTLVIQTPNSTSFLARLFGKYWPPYTPVEHIHIFSRKSLIAVLRKFGFKDIVFKKHWKKLSTSYIYEMFRTFSPVFYGVLSPLYRIFPKSFKNARFTFYIGEVIVFARRH